jgi:hypothetical protein
LQLGFNDTFDKTGQGWHRFPDIGDLLEQGGCWPVIKIEKDLGAESMHDPPEVMSGSGYRLAGRTSLAAAIVKVSMSGCKPALRAETLGLAALRRNRV